MAESQLYDSALKSLLGDEVAEILPNLLPGSQYVSEQNIEIDRTTLKADLVYNLELSCVGQRHYLLKINSSWRNICRHTIACWTQIPTFNRR